MALFIVGSLILSVDAVISLALSKTLLEKVHLNHLKSGLWRPVLGSMGLFFLANAISHIILLYHLLLHEQTGETIHTMKVLAFGIECFFTALFAFSLYRYDVYGTLVNKDR